MRFNTLINFIDDNNHHNIIAALKFTPEKIYFIRNKSKEHKEAFPDLKDYLADKLPRTTVVEREINVMDPAAVDSCIRAARNGNTLLNLSGCSALDGIYAYKTAESLDLPTIFIDMKNEKVIKLIGEEVEFDISFIDLSVEDLIASTGAEIVKHSSEFVERQEFRAFIDYITQNYTAWLDIKGIFRNPHLTWIIPGDALSINIEIGKLQYSQKSGLKRFVDQMVELNMIKDFSINSNLYEITFANRESKSFIMMWGTWLEALTYKVMREIHDINDTKCGVLFLWDKDSVNVTNELDVVAAKDSRLICISCKDTSEYDVDELNELEVYSQQLGGENVLKVLISTMRPKRGEMVYQRAREMGISIIVFDGDVDKLKRRLEVVKRL